MFINTWPQNMTNLTPAIRPPTPAERDGWRKERNAEVALEGDELDGDRCRFCKRKFAATGGLKQPLAPWRKQEPKADDKYHRAKDVRAFALQQWGE